MRISDWSSDVCSSDLDHAGLTHRNGITQFGEQLRGVHVVVSLERLRATHRNRTTAIDFVGGVRRARQEVHLTLSRLPAVASIHRSRVAGDRKRVMAGKSVSARADLGGHLFFINK